MTIGELKAERRVVEEQLEQLKKQYDRVDYEVNLNGWRQMTPEEKKLEEEYKQKQIVFGQLIADQIKRVVASQDNVLIEDYYDSIPEKYVELKILFFSHKKFNDGQMMDILNKYTNYEFLNGLDNNPYLSEDDFDDAMAMLGPDGIKIEYLNSMLNILDKVETPIDSIEIRDHILKTIAGFSSPEIAIELFRCIFKPENMNSKIREGLCERFASLMEQYQEMRKKYDVEALESGNRMINFDRYYLINFQSFHNKLITLPEESRRIIEDLSIANAERIRQKIKPKPFDKEEMTRILLSKYGVIEKDIPNSETNGENLSIASIIDQIIADGNAKNDIDENPEPAVISAPAANEEVVIDTTVKTPVEPTTTRKINKLPNPVRIIRRKQEYPFSSTPEEYEKLIEQRKAERGFLTGLSVEEIKEQDYQKFKKAILDVMNPNNVAISLEEFMFFMNNNPDVMNYKNKYWNNKNNDSQSIETVDSTHTK